MLYKINNIDFSDLVKRINVQYKTRKLGEDRYSMSGKAHSAKTKTVSVVTAIIEPVSEEEFQSLMDEVSSKYVSFTYHDPHLGDRTVQAIPGGDIDINLAIEGIAVSYWDGMVLVMEER